MVPSARKLQCLGIVYFLMGVFLDGVFLDGFFFVGPVGTRIAVPLDCTRTVTSWRGRAQLAVLLVRCLCFVFGFCCAWWSGCEENLNMAKIVVAAFGLACSACVIFGCLFVALLTFVGHYCGWRFET